MKRNALALVLAAISLGGCEPLRGIVSEKDFHSLIDIECVDATLRKTFGKIERWDYIDDGSSFPKGTEVAQFAYYRTEDSAGRATLDIGRINKKTRVTHSFTGIGAELPQHSFPPAMGAMRKASFALKSACNLDLSGMELKEVGQNVEALN